MVYYYILNEHGDVVQLRSAGGTCNGSYEYDAFGVERNPDEEDDNPFRYCGEYYDLSCSTYYLRARNYRATTGRFLTEDPVKDGLNWYTYCLNDPVAFIDPSGLVSVGVNAYAKTYSGSTITIHNNDVTVSWNSLSFSFHVTDDTYIWKDKYSNGDWYIDDSIFVDAFGIGDQKLVVYQDSILDSVSIRANFNITGDAVDDVIKKDTYKTLFLQGIQEHWSGNFGKYNVSTYTGESKNGIRTNIGHVNLSDKNDKSHVARLFGLWSLTNPGKLNMRTGNGRDGSIYKTKAFKWASAHEFGHVLGVEDAYISKNSTGVKSIFNEWLTRVQEGDITKVLEASKKNKWQRWQ